MIPQIIHYCWFGHGEKSQLIKKCIDSWKVMLPDYEIIEWNESNFDIHVNRYVEEAYERKKWAFVADYARLYALYNHGGIYLDTDMEVFKSFDCFLGHSAFTGFESNDSVQAGVIAAEKGHKVIEAFLELYSNKTFINDNVLNLTTIVNIITDYFKDNGLKTNGKKQQINDVMIYPAVYFCPNTFGMIFGKVSSKSFTVHYYDGSWLDEKEKDSFKYKIGHWGGRVIRDFIGTDRYKKIRGIK